MIIVEIPFAYENSPIDLIRARSSVRRFTGEPLPVQARREMERCCLAANTGPFGGGCRFRLVDSRSPGEGGERGERVGAYGIIRGAATYLVGAAPGVHALEDFGYLFELLLLKATDLGLGSCWLGGTFTRSRFAVSIGLRQEEILPAVSPIGVPTERRSMVDRVIRWGAGSKRRKPWAELFCDGRTGQPLSPERANRFATALEMVRLAPSASNRQPWRCLLEGGRIHFYLRRFPGYRSILPTDLQRIDMGIATSHFDLATAASGLEGRWEIVEPPPAVEPPAWQKAEYLVSWVLER
ncbi:MAG: hypothetical protein JXB06_08775 [Spirochaetales bacterium]|nr:hypothetical protein [Spirochaetales bacterium]